MRVWANQQRQVHIHTRFTFTHASHSHTLHIHTRFPFTHASHSHTLHIHTRFTFTHAHTRDNLFESCRILRLLISVLGNTGSVKFTFTHAHTRDNLFCGETHLARQHAFPRPIACVTSNSAAYTRGFRIHTSRADTRATKADLEHTHTLVKGLRRCTSYLL